MQLYQNRVASMPTIDSENIYPKRLGIMRGNILILEYYNIDKDKFKKHQIPFNPLDDTKSILDNIFKDTKHIPYLRKVDIKQVKAVLEGQNLFIKKPIKQPNSPELLTRFKQQAIESPPRQKQTHFHQIKKLQPETNLSDRIKKIVEQQKIAKEEINDYYEDQFESISLSQSMDKLKLGGYKTENSSLSISAIEKIESQKKKEKKEEKKIQEEPIAEEIVEEYQDDFQFIDEEVKPAKSEVKKKKKGKSKDKKEKKPKKEANANASQPTVEEEFQFL